MVQLNCINRFKQTVFFERSNKILKSKIFKIFKILPQFHGKFPNPDFWPISDSRKLESEVQKYKFLQQRVLHVFMNPRDFCTHSAGRGNECTIGRISGHPKFSYHEKFPKSGDDVGLQNFQTEKPKIHVFFERSKNLEIHNFQNLIKSFQIRTFGRFRTPGN